MINNNKKIISINKKMIKDGTVVFGNMPHTEVWIPAAKGSLYQITFGHMDK